MSFHLKTKNGITIRFQIYHEEAPITSKAFISLLPFSQNFYHARISGQEIWVADAINLNIIQENASVFTLPGEMVLGPSKPSRVKTSNALGIYYGEGKGLDAANIFARVYPEDLQLLQTLGESIWKHGEQELRFEKSQSI